MKKYFILFVLILTLGVACGGAERLTSPTADTSAASEAGLCENATDDDGDSVIDCDDSDCQSDAICLGATVDIVDISEVSGTTNAVTAEANCSDALDDEGDGLIDCNDDECATNSFCLDNDGDGYSEGANVGGSADCDDANAAVNVMASEATNDSIDNDCDGSIDEVVAELSCQDGLDDDADGAIDCRDSDCALNSVVEISGDGVDQNCDGFDFATTDENVKWVDPVLGDDKNADGSPNTACSVDLPCRTIEHTLSGMSGGDTVAVMHGQYAPGRDLYLNKGVSLLGGFFRDASGNMLRNIAQQPSIIHLDSDVNIVVTPDGRYDRAAVTLNGFTILGQYATSSTPVVTGKIQVINHPFTTLSQLMVVVDSEDAAAAAYAYGIKVDAVAPLPEMHFNLTDSTVRIGNFAATVTSVYSTPVRITNSAADVLNANVLGNAIHCGNMSATIKVHCMAISGSESSMPLNVRLIDNTINMGARNSMAGSYGYGVTIEGLANGRFTATGNTVLASPKDTSMGILLNDVQDVTIADNNFVIQDQGRAIIAVMVENSSSGGRAMIHQNIFDLGKASSSYAVYLRSISSQILNNAILQDEVTTEAKNIYFEGSGDIERLTVSNNIFSNASVFATNIYVAGNLYNGSSCSGHCTNIKAISHNDVVFSGSTQDISFFDETGVTPSMATGGAANCAAFTTSGTVTSQTCLVDYLAAMNTVNPARVLGNLSVPHKMSFDAEKHQWVLAADSRLIDSGALPAGVDADGDTDFYGNPRVVDGLEDGTATIDIGPVEYQPAAE